MVAGKSFFFQLAQARRRQRGGSESAGFLPGEGKRQNHGETESLGRIANLRFEISEGKNSRRNDRISDVCIHRADSRGRWWLLRGNGQQPRYTSSKAALFSHSRAFCRLLLLSFGHVRKECGGAEFFDYPLCH